MTEVRPFSPTPMDLALVRRLAGCQLSMDTTTALTRGVNPLESALLTVVPLADLGFPTLVLRDQDQGYIGQVRHRAGDTHAHLVSLAPAPVHMASQTPWLNLIDGLVATAGRRGALTLNAEIAETAFAAFEILRRTGFVVYVRQTLYQRKPAKVVEAVGPKRVRLRPVTSRDIPRLHLLYTSLVPRLVQQADMIPQHGLSKSNGASLVVESVSDGRLLGYLAVAEGRTGIMLKPLLHPDIFDEAQPVMSKALTLWSKIERLPLYVCVRSYQEWIGTPLIALGLEEMERQVIFVKHTVARVEAAFERLPATVETALGTLAGKLEATLHQDRFIKH